MSTRRRPAGRAVLQDDVTSALSAAALDELALVGYARLSMEAVARRAGVGKAALYRRWKSKHELAVSILRAELDREPPHFPDTGTLTGDLQAFMVRTLAEISDSRTQQLLLDLVAETARVPTLANPLWQAVATPRRQAAVAMLNRAQERDEIPADIDYDLAIDLLIAPLLFRVVTRGTRDLNDRSLERLVRATVAGLSACRGPAADTDLEASDPAETSGSR